METDLRKPADGGSVATPYGRRSSGSSAAGQCSFRSEVDPPFLKHPKGLGSWYRWNERLSVWWRGRDGASMTIAPEGRRHVKSRRDRGWHGSEGYLFRSSRWTSCRPSPWPPHLLRRG